MHLTLNIKDFEVELIYVINAGKTRGCVCYIRSALASGLNIYMKVEKTNDEDHYIVDFPQYLKNVYNGVYRPLSDCDPELFDRTTPLVFSLPSLGNKILSNS